MPIVHITGNSRVPSKLKVLHHIFLKIQSTSVDLSLQFLGENKKGGFLFVCGFGFVFNFVFLPTNTIDFHAICHHN